MSTSYRGPLIALVGWAVVGALFAGISTFDFAAHLDRQVHSITCSVTPGLSAPDSAGTSGCHAALMSPYSSVLRSWTWGGIPISLAALSVFAFIVFRALELLLRREDDIAAETGFLVAATALPLAMSIIYFLVSVLKVGAMCTVCVAIYVASIGCFAAAVIVHRRANLGRPVRRAAWSSHVVHFCEGVVLVVVPILLYLLLKPAYPVRIAHCGELLHVEDRYDVKLRLPGSTSGVPALEVLDPLCPACKGLSLRLAASGLTGRLNREILLFPLDAACNWMVQDSLHPGSCVVSEAILAAGPQGSEVLDWVLAHQEELREVGARDEQELVSRIVRRFPKLLGAIGSPPVKAKLNRSLRWAVSNSLPVLTPQLFIDGKKVCDEDTDLGLEYVLTRLLAERPAAMAAGGR